MSLEKLRIEFMQHKRAKARELYLNTVSKNEANAGATV